MGLFPAGRHDGRDDVPVGIRYVSHQSTCVWALITLLVFLLHDAYDGMIWESKKRPSTA